MGQRAGRNIDDSRKKSWSLISLCEYILETCCTAVDTLANKRMMKVKGLDTTVMIDN
jgi:hypothetical protein